MSFLLILVSHTLLQLPDHPPHFYLVGTWSNALSIFILHILLPSSHPPLTCHPFSYHGPPSSILISVCIHSHISTQTHTYLCVCICEYIRTYIHICYMLVVRIYMEERTYRICISEFEFPHLLYFPVSSIFLQMKFLSRLRKILMCINTTFLLPVHLLMDIQTD